MSSAIGGTVTIIGLMLRYTLFERWSPGTISEPGTLPEELGDGPLPES